MQDDFRLDARCWRYLDHPESYIREAGGSLLLEPLTRQFHTAKDILTRLCNGQGVLLADDVGLGKTTVAALVAWALACQDKRVRIYAPNVMMQRRWAEELERHVRPLRHRGARSERIKQGDVEKLHAGRIQVSTHHALVKTHRSGQQRGACDLMIVDEVHRARGEASMFHQALAALGAGARRKLILTATPMSIQIDELMRLLHWAGARQMGAVRRYAQTLDRLHRRRPGYDAHLQADRLVKAAAAAIEALQPYLIRHGVDDLAPAERRHFGTLAPQRWTIATPPATPDDVALLLRMDRILHLLPERPGERRNDPRFHVGWQHLTGELERVRLRCDEPTAGLHLAAARQALEARRGLPHPKVAAVCQAIAPVVQAGEKVLVFCHHRSSAHELLSALELALKLPEAPPEPTLAFAEALWRSAWQTVLAERDPLVEPLIDWLCSPGVRRQVGQWLGQPPRSPAALAARMKQRRPRGAPAGESIADAARALKTHLLAEQSRSTRALLRNLASSDAFGRSRFPGDLDAGHRVMGFWSADGGAPLPPLHTLYAGSKEPDVVLALFNSPFGPDVLVTTDRLSEGVDLHRYCRHLIHYELDPSPVRTLQRNGRVRRVGSWAAQTGRPICYGYPTFVGTRDEKATEIMARRLQAFGLLLGGVPALESDILDEEQNFSDAVLRVARGRLHVLNLSLTSPVRSRLV